MIFKCCLIIKIFSFLINFGPKFKKNFSFFIEIFRCLFTIRFYFGHDLSKYYFLCFFYFREKRPLNILFYAFIIIELLNDSKNLFFTEVTAVNFSFLNYYNLNLRLNFNFHLIISL